MRHTATLIVFLIITLITANAQTRAIQSFANANTLAFKYSPNLVHGLSSGSIFAEKAINSYFSLQGGLTRHAGFSNLSNTMIVMIKPYTRLEMSARYYPMETMQRLFFQTGFGVDNHGSTSAFGGFGYAEHLFNRIPVEVNIAVQNASKSESYDSGIFLRTGVAIGLAF